MSIDLIKENGFTLFGKEQTISRRNYYGHKQQSRPQETLRFQVDTNKTEYMCFNQERDISTLNGGSQKLVDKYTYLHSSISSTESDEIPSENNHMEVWYIR